MKSRIVILVVLSMVGSMSFAKMAMGSERVHEPDTSLDRFIPELNETAEREFRATFGGAWVKPGSELRDGIFVGFTEDAAKKVASLRSIFPDPTVLKPVTVERPIVDLERILEEVGAVRDAFQAAGRITEGDPQSALGLDIDVSSNQVVVLIPGETKEIAAALAHFGNAVRIEESGPAGPLCADRFHCGKYLRSGLKIKPGIATSWCSTAFTIGYGSSTQIFTAGHCQDVGNQWYHTGLAASDNFGSVQQQIQGWVVDVARISIANGFQGLPRIYREDDEQNVAVEGKATWNGIIDGMMICKSGATTDKTCGTVIGKYFQPGWIDGGALFLRSDMCAQPGDSGAGVYRGGYATAILSGGLLDACSAANFYTASGFTEFAEAATGGVIKTIP